MYFMLLAQSPSFHQLLCPHTHTQTHTSSLPSLICSQQYIPFAVIGSDREVTVGGKKVLGRQTKWGFIEVENKRHCEFAQLRDMLIR